MSNRVLNSGLSTSSTTSENSTNNSLLIFINVNTQLPIKLSPTNFPSWRTQFNSLMLGHNLYGYLNGSMSTQKLYRPEGMRKLSPNPDYKHWFQQDHLLLYGIIASASESVVSFIASCTSSYEAWEKVVKLYANKSRSRMMNIRGKLSSSRGLQTVSEYFQCLRSIADALALINSPVTKEELVISALDGIGEEFNGLVTGIHVRETEISFENLLDKMLDYETYLHKQNILADQLISSANYSTKKHQVYEQSSGIAEQD